MAVQPLLKCELMVSNTHVYAFAGVVHPITGETITSYRKLAHDPATREMWTTVFVKEIVNLAQGDTKTGTKGTNFIFFLTHSDIHQIPKIER